MTRILATKLRYFRGRDAPLNPNPSSVRTRVPAPGARDFFVQVSARAVTLIAGKRIPYRPARGEKILLCGQFSEFLAEGLRRYPGADTLLFPFSPFYGARSQDKAAVRARAAAYDTVIFCLANYNSLDVLQELKDMGRKVIVISALSPVYLTRCVVGPDRGRGVRRRPRFLPRRASASWQGTSRPPACSP